MVVMSRSRPPQRGRVKRAFDGRRYARAAASR